MNAVEADLVRRLYRALDDAVDSLKYVQSAHPEASGRGVRAERILRAEAVMAIAREQNRNL